MAFGGRSSKGKQRAEAGANGHAVEPTAEAIEEGEGYNMGSGRGRGRDGAGTYEMVGMAPREPG